MLTMITRGVILDMENTDTYRIFNDGIDNILATDIEEIQDCNFKLRNLKMLLFYIITALFSSKKDLTNEVYFIGRPDKEEVFSRESTVSKVYRQRCIKSFTDIRNKTTIMSVFSRYDGIKLIVKSLRDGRKLIKQSIIKEEYLSYWIDYYLIWKFLECKHPSLVIHRFHYDEKATWIGELKKEYDYEVNIYQHGVVTGELKLPHRILANRVFCLDKYSVSYFKNEILDDDVQEVAVYDFPECLEFTMISDDNKYENLIGIAEQCNEKWTFDLVSKIVENCNDCIVYIMLHPQSNADYSYFDKYPNIRTTTKKIENLDILITYNSTLIIDYYHHRKDYKIFFMSENDMEMYRDYPFICTANVDSILELLIHHKR